MKSILLFIFLSPTLLWSQQTKYEVTSITDSITIDGDISDWDSIPFSNRFSNHVTGDTLNNKAQFKACYDQQYFYFAFQVFDASVTHQQKAIDAPIFKTDDCVEMFLDFDGDGKNYLELGVAPSGIYYDIHVTCPPSKCGTWNSDPDFNLDNLKLSAKTTAEQWTVEVKIPFESLKKIPNSGFSVPKKGSVWRANLFNINYQKDNKEAPLYNSWSVINSFGFHQPDFFGTLVFQ